MMKTTSHFGLLSCVLAIYSASVMAQPPEPRKPRKPVAPPISLAEANKEFGGPTLVTLHLKDVSPEEVLNQFSLASGVLTQMQYWGGRGEQKKLVSLDIDNQPFWIAVSEICKKLGFSPEPYSREAGLMLSPYNIGWIKEKGMSLSPLVMLRLDSVNHGQTLSLQDETGVPEKAVPSDHAMSIQGMLLFDPKVRLLENQMRVVIAEAVDEKGVSMAGEYANGYGQSPLMWSMSISLKWRADMGKKITTLRGSGKCYVITKSEVLEVPDVMNSKEVSKTVRTPQGDETYTFLGVQKNGNQYQVRMKITRPQVLAEPEMTPEEYRLADARRNISSRLKLLGADGRAFPWQGENIAEEFTNFNFGEFRNFGMAQMTTTRLQEPAGPQKLILEIPTEVRELEIPFVLKEIPLP